MGRPSSDTAGFPPDKLPKVENALNTPNIWSSLTQQCSVAHCTQCLYPESCTQHSLHNTPQHLYPSTSYTVPVHSTLHSAPRINHPVHKPCPCIHSLCQAADWELWSLLLPSTKGAPDCSLVLGKVQSQSSTRCHSSHPKARTLSEILTLWRLPVAINHLQQRLKATLA